MCVHDQVISSRILFPLLILMIPIHVLADVSLPVILRDSMILQRNAESRIWGWAETGELVTVDFNGQTQKTKATETGTWSVTFDPMQAGGPYSMAIKGQNTITLKDILIGDVWFCSGQSNMVHQMRHHDVTYARDIAEANNPQIRQFLIPTMTALAGPKDDFPDISWKTANPDDAQYFSAVAYFFAQKIHARYGVPIGIINASVGGTPIEAWTRADGFDDFPTIQETIEKNRDTSYVNSTNRAAREFRRQNQVPENDKGLIGEVKWYDENYIPKNWRNINIPGYWEDQGAKDLNGVVWYRKQIEIPASMVAQPATVFLGRIVDADQLYINGTLVGQTTYQYPQRKYPVPEDLLKAGKNMFVIRVTNRFNKGGFVPDKPYFIFTENDTVDLKGYWKYKVGDVYKPFEGERVSGISAQNQPTSLYNAMVSPATPFKIKGFLWYQGESNAGRPETYQQLQRGLIKNWRKIWGQGELPFLYVQLPNFLDVDYLPSESNWALMREAQMLALQEPNTGMAVAIDLGEWNDIHPDNKKDVGERLAENAFRVAYGETIVGSGPIFRSASVYDDKIVVEFDFVGQGLKSLDGEALSEFAIAGEDKRFVWAVAKIVNDKVEVRSDEIKNPKYVRYAWANNPDNPNLGNSAGIPASPFRTDQ